MSDSGTVAESLLIALYAACFVVQYYLAFGTAYRRSKRGGDNGLALFGWLLVYWLAALVPGLGAYLWFRSNNDVDLRTREASGKPRVCEKCGATLPDDGYYCESCGARFTRGE